MSEISIGARLLSAAKFVRQGAVFADIGTDHAYLPVFLLRAGVIKHAVCSDINEGPLENARKTALSWGVSDRISFSLSDGADGLRDDVSDVAICGMGGELIAKIIDEAPSLRTKGVRLILQPMTKQEHLREYLDRNGFSVVGERYCTEAGKSYLVLAAEYTGKEPSENLSSVRYGTEAQKERDAYENYLKVKLKSKRGAYEGLLAGGITDAELYADVKYIESLLVNSENA